MFRSQIFKFPNFVATITTLQHYITLHLLQQFCCDPSLSFDWLSVSFFDYWPIRISDLLLSSHWINPLRHWINSPLHWITWKFYFSKPGKELSNFSMYFIRAQITRVIWNHRYDLRPKLHDTRFNHHFITSILKSPKYRTWSGQIFYWCSTEPVWN